MAHSEAITIIENLMDNFAFTLVNEDETITGLTASTNCDSWGLDDSDVKAWFMGNGKIEFAATLYLGGDQDPDKAMYGSEIEANVKGKAVGRNGTWSISEYEIVKAEIKLD
jgi:hypothetical protein